MGFQHMLFIQCLEMDVLEISSLWILLLWNAKSKSVLLRGFPRPQRAGE